MFVFISPVPNMELLLIMKDLLIINQNSFTRHWMSRLFFYGWLIHILHPFMFMSPIAFHAFHSLSSHSLQVAAVATLSTLPQARAMHKAGGRRLTRAASRGDSVSESRKNRTSQHALPRCFRLEGLSRTVQCGHAPSNRPHGPFFGWVCPSQAKLR